MSLKRLACFLFVLVMAFLASESASAQAVTEDLDDGEIVQLGNPPGGVLTRATILNEGPGEVIIRHWTPRGGWQETRVQPGKVIRVRWDQFDQLEFQDVADHKKSRVKMLLK